MVDLNLKSFFLLVNHMYICIQTRVYKGRCLDNKHIDKRSVAWQTWTLHQSSNIARFSIVK